MAKTADEAGVRIVAGDTKVAGKGQVDHLFITTTGIGQIVDGVHTSGTLARPGDAVIVSGDVGRHGCTILLARNQFGIDADVTSDCAPLWGTVKAMLDTTKDIHVIRDATRGASARSSTKSPARAMSHPFGQPGYPRRSGRPRRLRHARFGTALPACEGRLVIFAPKAVAGDIVATLRQGKYSKDAAIIGEVTADQPGRVIMRTEIGAETLLPPPGGELLPRIC